MTRSKWVCLSVGVVLLSGCVSHLRPYKMDVRQGNYISAEMREKLKLGMSKQQVRYVMGTPLLVDAFHGDRWDYRYRLAEHGTVVEQQGMTLYFEGDTLARIDDAAMPALPPAPAVEAAPPVAAASAVPETQPAPVAAAAPDAAVKAGLAAWAAAWSARDGKAYLAAYAPAYKPEGMSRAAWQKQRLQRMAKAKSITVTLSEVEVTMQDDNHASVRCTQDYRADLYHDVTRKLMQLERSGDAWLIVSETTAK